MATVTYPCYWQKKDNGGYWYWIYYASNGKAISRSSESESTCATFWKPVRWVRIGAELVIRLQSASQWGQIEGRSLRALGTSARAGTY